MWSFSARRLIKRLSNKKLKIVTLDDFLRKLWTTGSIERTVMIDFKMCCLYVVLVLPDSMETQLGWSGKFCYLVCRVGLFLPVSIGTESIKNPPATDCTYVYFNLSSVFYVIVAVRQLLIKDFMILTKKSHRVIIKNKKSGTARFYVSRCKYHFRPKDRPTRS